MTNTESVFYGAALSAGAILTGFCGTFLAFRLQREAAYYRQVAIDFKVQKARDVYVGLTHFTAPLLLLLSATLISGIAGFVIPLLALAGVSDRLARPPWIAAGEVAALILLAGYFVGELVHYRVLNQSLVSDAREWGVQWPVLIVTSAVACLAAIGIMLQ